MSEPMNHPSIAVIGAGPGGLTFARILHTRGIKCEILEGEAHESVRPQGGSLDLHDKGGLWALEIAGLVDAFRALARPEDQVTTVCDPSGERLFRGGDADGSRPEIDRTDLRRIMMDSIPADMIHWNSRVSTVEERSDGRWDVVFPSDEKRTYDLVVGADGAWSKVRPLLTDAVPYYERVTLAELNAHAFDERFPHLADIVGRGTLFVYDAGKGLIAQRNSGQRLRIYAIIEGAVTDLAHALFALSPAEHKAHIIAHYAGWSPDFVALIDACDEDVVVRPVNALPVGLTWPSRAGVTLIGDAAHLMSPFAGEGVNMAMADAAELALALTSGAPLGEAVASYEDGMYRRSRAAAAQSAEGLRMAVSAGGSQKLLAVFSAHSG